MSNYAINSNVAGYIDYFRQLAVKHAVLQHNTASETGDVEPGTQRFAKISVDQVLQAMGSKMGPYCLCIEMYETPLKTETVNEIRTNPRGAFMVLVKPATKSHADEEASFAMAESITYDLLQKIWQDHYKPGANRCATPFKDFHFNETDITPVNGIFKDYNGYRVEYAFTFQTSIKLATAPRAGAFTD